MAHYDPSHDREALIAAFESAMRSGAEAAIAVFRREIGAKLTHTGGGEPPAGRYKAGSWKRTIVEILVELTKERPEKDFRFSELKKFNERLQREHPGQASPLSGAAVVLQQLVRDGVLLQLARGHYRLK